MKIRVEITVLCLLSLVWIKQIQCGNFSNTEWTCTCLANRENQRFTIQENCLSSCKCSSDGENTNRWICICSADALPRVDPVNEATNCFTSCTCNSGTPMQVQTSKKKIPKEISLMILLVCVTLTILSLIASALCYIYKPGKRPIQRPLYSLDTESSISSNTNLISRGTSVADYPGYVISTATPDLGCIPKALFLLGKKSGVIHGTISRFSYSELASATEHFSESHVIGVGGSSHVYRGHLKDGRTVAIKRIKTKGGPDAESVFLTEIKLISRLHHCHVVPLLGYCSENQGKHAERLLVFEDMPHGNLRDCLDGAFGKCLDWKTRIGIALGAARGLEYLHEAAAPRILHRDVKSTNILLDENWKPKITDLGMAKHLLNEGIPSGSSSPARMQGTFGYFAPEYAIVGRASLKSDVFSFGVVLLELITGRQPIYKSSNKTDESLVIWAMPILQDSKRVSLELPDPHLEGLFQEEELQVMAYLAKECLLMDPDSRPTMSEVVQILSTIAPEKSRRKNMPLNHFQSLSSKNLEIHNGQDSPQVDIKEITSEKEKQCSDINRCLCSEKGLKEVDTNKGLLITNDDEIVDLTEPRFESFCEKI